MRAVLQRVAEAAVSVAGEEIGRIGPGLLVLLGCAAEDDASDVDWLAGKIVRMRIFADAAGKMNRSVADTGGDILCVSQFTLHAATRKGNRPSFIGAASGERAMTLYTACCDRLGQLLGRPVATGRFAADMQVALVNDGPVTICIDSRDRE
ncbi:MAG: D-aminoacyl-tRNA deacylase [Planctomycetota bacterium]